MDIPTGDQPYAISTPMTTENALTLLIFSHNTRLDPSASSPEDVALLDAREDEAVAKVSALRNAALDGDASLIKHLFTQLLEDDLESAQQLLGEIDSLVAGHED